MILNKSEWETINRTRELLYKYAGKISNEDNATIKAFCDLCDDSRARERETRQKTAACIAERRKQNPDYGRPEREHRKNKYTRRKKQ